MLLKKCLSKGKTGVAKNVMTEKEKSPAKLETILQRTCNTVASWHQEEAI